MNRWHIGGAIVIALGLLALLFITVVTNATPAEAIIIGMGCGLVAGQIGFPMWEIGNDR